MRRVYSSSRSGQSLVEFAIILPLLMLLVVVIFDLGRVVYYSSTIHNAAREAARWGIVYPDIETNIQDKAIDYAVGLGLQRNQITVCWHYDPSDVHSFPPPSVKITVVYSFRPAIPLVSRFLPGGQLSLEGDATMKLEALPDINSINNCRY
jgi:hypothetical protein